jgi:probable HAF family extracellular repeat protein
MRKAAICTILFTLGICLAGAAPAAAILYTCKDLGSLGGNTEAYGINATGNVVGSSQTSSGAYHAFLYSGGVMQDLGTLPAYNSSSYASAINKSGQVGGAPQTLPGPPTPLFTAAASCRT